MAAHLRLSACFGTGAALNHFLVQKFRTLKFHGLREHLFRTMTIYPGVIMRSLLAPSFQRLLKMVPRSNLLVLQYEKCKSHPAEQIAKTYPFLGIDDSFIPPSLNRMVNVRKHLLPGLTEEERQILGSYFSDDVSSLIEMFPDIDRSLWPDFGDR